jgi:cytochrome P450
MPPVPAAPLPPDRFPGFIELVRTVRDSSIATYPKDAYERDFIDRSFLWAHVYIINDTDAVKRVLVDNATNYTKTRLARRLLEPGLGQGLLTSEGETWRRHRRVMAPAFDPRSVASYAPLMGRHADAMLSAWDRFPDGSELALDRAMMRLTLDIIADAMFSTDAADIADLVAAGTDRYQNEVRPTLFDLLPLPHWLPRRPLRRAGDIFTAFDRKIEAMIADRRGNGAERKDLLARLLSARDEESGAGLSVKEVRDEVVTIFMAGHETTSLALTWAFYLLSQHPQVEAKLVEELSTVLEGRSAQAEDVPKLRYTRMVIDEALRLYPPAHTLAREAIGADELAGRRIPPGATVYIVPWLLHRHRPWWDQPERFDPDRFAPERAAERPRFAYLPFGAGPRICIGAAFAVTEAVLLLATIARRYRLRLKPGHRVEPRGLITLRPRNGVAMLLERRTS